MMEDADANLASQDELRSQSHKNCSKNCNFSPISRRRRNRINYCKGQQANEEEIPRILASGSPCLLLSVKYKVNIRVHLLFTFHTVSSKVEASILWH